MAFNDTFSISDPAANAQDAIVSQALTDALAAWSQYIDGVGTLKIQLNITNLSAGDTSSSEVLADASSTTARSTGTFVNGEAIYQGSAAYELTTGNHLAASDITINVNSAILSQLVNEESDNLVQVLEHELAHGFGINGFRQSNGQLAGIASPFDALSVILPNGRDYFTGAAASTAFGGVVPLTTTQGAGSNYYHVGIGNAADPPSLSNDLMYWISGAGRSISGLDVGILEDIGIPISTAGQVLIDPNPSSTIFELAGNGTTSVISAGVGGVTQPDEVVTILSAGVALGTVQAASSGAWSFTPTGLADGTYVLTADITGAGGVVQVGSQYVVLDTASPLHLTYWQVIGQDASAASLATGQSQLQNGTPLQAIRTYLADSGYAVAALDSLYQGAIGRTPVASELPADEAYLAGGGTLTALLGFLASSAEEATKLGGVDQAVVGRAITTTELVSDEAAIAQYYSIGGIRYLLATTAEAAAKLQAVYSDVVARPASTADISGDETAIGTGAITLAGLRTYLADTQEADTKLNAVYQSVLGRSMTAAETTANEALIANGESLVDIQTNLLAGLQTTVLGTYETVLGRAPSAAELTAAEQTLQNGGAQQTLVTSLVSGSEFAADVSQPTMAALGRPANAVEIAADGAEFSAGGTYTTLQAQLGQLTGGAPPVYPVQTISGTTEITPQTIAGPAPNFVYGLLNNDALIASQPETVSLTFSGNGSATIAGFNPATDIIQIQSHQDGSFSELLPTARSATEAVLTIYNPGHVFSSIFLPGVPVTQLTAANFRFV